jgi:hypothetical protein
VGTSHTLAHFLRTITFNRSETKMRKLILAATLAGLSAGAAFAQGTNPSAPHPDSTGTRVETPGITSTGTAVDRPTTGNAVRPQAVGSEAGNNANSIGGPNSAAGNDPNSATGRTSGGGAAGSSGGASGTGAGR